MLLATSGCSHSVELVFRSGKESIKKSWPKFLAEKLDATLYNLSDGGKDNHNIFLETMRFLSDRRYPNPDYLVVQWTDPNRICLFRNQETESRLSIGNDGISLFRINHYIKLDHYNEIKFKDWGAEEKTAKILSGNNNQVEKENILLYTYAIQELCHSKDIKVCFVTYADMVQYKYHLDPYWERIDHRDWLIHNPKDSVGWYQHLLWGGFEPWSHGHFKEDANEYNASCILNNLKNNERVYTETDIFITDRQIYRYEGE